MDIVHCCRRGLTWCFFASLLLANPAPGALAEDAQEKSGNSPDGSRLAPLGLEKLMDLEVSTVTRQESTVGRSPAAVSVITEEDIRRSGATTIPELFRRVPGINVARIDNSKWAISARGFAERFFGKMLVQIDGRTLYNPFTSGVYWDAVDYPLEDIERIEVVRGPRAGTWGANAVNGIINIITKSSQSTHGGLLTAGGGTQEEGFGTGRYGAKNGDQLHYRVYAKGFHRSEQYAHGTDAHDAWSGASGGFRVDWNPRERETLTFEGGYLRSDADRHDFRAQPAAPYLFENRETESTDDGNLLARWTRATSDTSSWTVQAYWDTFRRYQHELRIPLRWHTYDLDLQHQFSPGRRQTFLWGAGYRLVSSFIGNSGRDNGFVFRLTDNENHKQTFCLYGEYQVALIEERLRLFLNTRLEHNDFTGVEIQPSLQLLFTPDTDQSVWFSVARAVRTPNLNETYANPRLLPVSPSPPTFPRQVENPELDSERVLAYQLGYRIQTGKSVGLDTALFYNVYDDLVTTSPGAPRPGAVGLDLPATVVNGLSGETYGAEVSATWQAATWWKLYGAYSYLRMILRRSRSGLPPSAEVAETESPRNQVYLQSSFNLPRAFEVDLIGRWVDSLTGFNPSGFPGVANEIPSYFACDVRVGWRPRENLELALVGQNLFDSHHPEFGTSPLVRSPLVEIRRAGYAKLTWRF